MPIPVRRRLAAAERETLSARGGVFGYRAGRRDALADQPVQEREDTRGRDPRGPGA